MFISKFSVEDWQGSSNKSSLRSVCDWKGIETAIKELDGHRKTLVTLEADDETHMAVGGGTNLYVVYLTFDNETFHYLVDPAKSDADQNLIVGGQEGIYPAKLCVDIDSALKAAKTFSELGTLDKSVIWEQDAVFEPA
jgi:Immunity protein Imm1